MSDDVYRSYKTEDLPAGFLRQRRNLLIFSIGSMIYIVGGGEPSNQINLFLGGITITRPEVLLIAWLIGFLYSAFRYRVYAINIEYSLHLERLESLYDDSRFIRFLRGQIKKGSNDRPQIQFKPNAKKPEAVLIVFRTKMKKWNESSSIVEIEPEELPIDYKDFSKFWWRAKIGAATNYRTTTDYWMPILIAWIALTLVLIEGILYFLSM